MVDSINFENSKNKRWTDILLGNQFLKLYFYKYGISNSLIIDRLIRIDDLRIKKSNEEFKFAIIKTKPNETNIDIHSSDDDKKFSFSRLDFQEYEKIFKENKFLFFSKINNYFNLNTCELEFQHLNDRVKYSLEEDRFMNLDTEKILFLAFSGFFNYYNREDRTKESNFFSRQNTPMTIFFDKMISFLASEEAKNDLVKHFEFQEKIKLQLFQKLNKNNILHYNDEDDVTKDEKSQFKKDYFEHEIISHYAEKMLRLDLSEAHHNIISKILENNKASLYTNSDCHSNYSLFFLKAKILWEWRESSGEIIKIGKNVEQEFSKEMILDYIQIQNKKSEVFYEDDITLFTELTDQPLENIEASSKNFFLTFILTFLFLINYFIVFPVDIFFEIQSSMNVFGQSFLINKKSNQSKKNFQDMKTIGENFVNILLDRIYFNKSFVNNTIDYGEQNTNKIIHLTEDIAILQMIQYAGIPPTINTSETNNSIYFSDVNVFSGLMFNFEVLQLKNIQSSSGEEYEHIPDTILKYYGEVYNIESDINELINSEITTSMYQKYPNTYEIYGKPAIPDEKESKNFKDLIRGLFYRYSLNKFAITLMIFNLEYKALCSFTIDISYDSLGSIENHFYFKAMLPFISLESSTFLVILILSLLIILGLIYLGFEVIRHFLNSIIDSINTKSNQININEFFDLSVILMIFTSQITFMKLFIFSREEFPLKTTSKEQMIIWLEKLETVGNYQKIMGICFFFMVMRLLKFFMAAIPSFGIVFQTLKHAYKEIVAFFCLICLMLGGMSSLTHFSFGYYSESFNDLTISYFHVYLMFVGIFDYYSLTSSDFANGLVPYFFIIFMIKFNLILMNLFISIVLNNYREVKKTYQIFNNVYSIMVQEKFEEFTSKLWDFLICKHPQQIEYEMKIKKEKNKNLKRLEIEEYCEVKERKNLVHEFMIINNKEELKDIKKNDNKLIKIKKPKFKSVSFFEKLAYNFNRLNLKNLFFGDGWSKEEYNLKKNELLEKMEYIYLEETIKEYSINPDKNFNYLVKTVFYVIYIIIFIFMMNIQLRLNINSEVVNQFRNTYEPDFKQKFVNMSQVQKQIFNFVNEFYRNNNTNSNQISNDSSTPNSIQISKNSSSSNNNTNKNNDTSKTDNGAEIYNDTSKSDNSPKISNDSSKPDNDTEINNDTSNHDNNPKIRNDTSKHINGSEINNNPSKPENSPEISNDTSKLNKKKYNIKAKRKKKININNLEYFKHSFEKDNNYSAFEIINNLKDFNKSYDVIFSKIRQLNISKNFTKNQKILPSQKNVDDQDQKNDYYQVDFNISNCSFELNQIFQLNYIMPNFPYFRFTFRLFSIGVNNDNQTNSIFPYVKLRDSILNSDNCNNDIGEFKFPIKYSNQYIKYTQPGEFQSASKCGGYVFLQGIYGLGCCDDDVNNAEEMDEFFKKSNLDAVYIEFPFVNVFDDHAVLIMYKFEKNKLGDIIFSSDYSVIPINRYNTKNDFNRAILECSFLIISILYLSFIVVNIFYYFLESFEADFEDDENKDDFKDSNFLNKFFRFNFNKFKNEGFMRSICEMLALFLTKILQAIFWLFQAVVSYLRFDGYNIYDFIYLIITITMMFSWYTIIHLTNKLNFKQSRELIYKLNDNEAYNIMILSELKLEYDSYFLFQAINGFILFIRILGVFKFSHGINNLIKVIYRAKSVVTFHVSSMIFFNIGFGLSGHALFSQTIKDFKSISSSFLEVLLIISGNINLQIFSNENKTIYIIYIILITFSNYLILLNILLSIVVQSYYDVKNENKINFGKEIKENFLSKITDIIYYKVLIIFERIEIYLPCIEFYDQVANEKILQFNNELIDKKANENTDKENQKDNFILINDNTKQFSFYKIFSNLKYEMDELSLKAELCERNRGDLDINYIKEKHELLEKKNRTIGILEKIFTYIYLNLFTKNPDINEILVKTIESKKITKENIFYKLRFNNDNSSEKIYNISKTIKNLYIKNLLISLTPSLVKNTHSFLEKNFNKKFQDYIKMMDHRKNKNHSQKMKINEGVRYDLYYAEKARDPLDNYEFLIYPDDLYKIHKLNYNKLLNIIIHSKNDMLNSKQNKNNSNFNNSKIEDIIEFNNNFRDILDDRNKLYKYLKIISMTYDLIVKHFHFPTDSSSEEKDAQLSFYLKKFLESQFNQMEIQNLNINLPYIKEKLFENDILKLFRFPLNFTDKNINNFQKLNNYLSDELISIHNEHFNDENDFDEYKDHINNLNIKNKNQSINEPHKNKDIKHYSKDPNASKVKNQDFYKSLQISQNSNRSNISERQNLLKSMTLIDEELNKSENGSISNSKIEYLVEFKEKCLSFYLIWNTIFIVFFHKNYKYVNFIEKFSYCKYLTNKYQEIIKANNYDFNDIKYKTSYLYLFIQLFFLDKPLNNAVHYKNKKFENDGSDNFICTKIEKNMKKLNEVRLLGKINENEIFNPINFFYWDINKYIFGKFDGNFRQNIKNESLTVLNQYYFHNKFKDFYPKIFQTMWNSVDQNIKKIIFFGLNEHSYHLTYNKSDVMSISQTLFYQDLIFSISEKELMTKNDCIINEKNSKDKNSFYGEIKIIPFFRTEQRSHIFHFLRFPSKKYEECKRDILTLSNKSITANDLNRYKNFENLFNFLYDSKLGLKYIQDVYLIIFDKLFKDIKNKIHQLINENEKNLNNIVFHNKKFFENPKSRVKFIKFYRYIFSMEKFEAIKGK